MRQSKCYHHKCSEPKNKNSKTVLSWKNYAKEKLIDNLRNCEWSLFCTHDIQNKVKLLRDNVKKSVIPLTKYVQINYESKPNKWYDNEISQLKDDKWQSTSQMAKW